MTPTKGQYPTDFCRRTFQRLSLIRNIAVQRIAFTQPSETFICVYPDQGGRILHGPVFFYCRNKRNGNGAIFKACDFHLIFGQETQTFRFGRNARLLCFFHFLLKIWYNDSIKLASILSVATRQCACLPLSRG